MKHSEWLSKVTDDSVRSIARTVGLPPRTLATQLEKERISPENVISIAIAYGAHPVRALVDTGYLAEKYARTVDPMTALRSVTEDQLAYEVLRRMKLGVETDNLTTPVDELAQRRAMSGAPATNDGGDDDGTVEEFDWDEPHAADSSPSETQARLERGEDPID
ncbi:hypothetical protein [Corynebacterium phoceense]|uniref:hypothetical protein n=1 Tax=Corynebacterium phoceense TaxID=1686286 RepID=UPI0011465335|nr:hypothetical protein [Corynebacterium phoceense]